MDTHTHVFTSVLIVVDPFAALQYTCSNIAGAAANTQAATEMRCDEAAMRPAGVVVVVVVVSVCREGRRSISSKTYRNSAIVCTCTNKPYEKPEPERERKGVCVAVCVCVCRQIGCGWRIHGDDNLV